jgi:(S)-sulfolactate dehydrogenase
VAQIVITEFMDAAGVEALREFDVLYDPQLVDKPEALRGALADCRGLIVRNRTQVRPPLLEAAPRLQVVGRLGVGLENLDLPACAARGIPVLPATGTNDDTVAEYVMGAMLAMLRGGAYQATAEVLAGKWPRTRLIGGRDAKGLTMGLVGFGAIARQVARRAVAFGMRVLASDPFVPAGHPAWKELGVERRELAAMLPEAQVLSLHVPMSPATRGIIDAAAIAALPEGAWVINTARGGLIDEHALVAALRSGRLAGATLDVVDQEPLAAGSHFDGVPNLILSPHIAGITRDANLRASLLTAENVRLVLQGKEPRVADAARSAAPAGVT